MLYCLNSTVANNFLIDYVSGLHNCLEFSQLSSCLDEAM